MSQMDYDDDEQNLSEEEEDEFEQDCSDDDEEEEVKGGAPDATCDRCERETEELYGPFSCSHALCTKCWDQLHSRPTSSIQCSSCRAYCEAL